MRNINWTSVTATHDGEGGQRLEPGAYVVRITEMNDVPDREYVEVVYDIAVGERAGYYSDEWGKSNPWAHHTFFSYKDKALGMLKGRLECINASNAGFDAFAAWDAGRLDMFVGRTFGANIRLEEYEKSDGSIGERLSVCEVRTAQDVLDGKVKPRDVKRLDASRGSGWSARPVAAAPAVDDSDIPF